MTEEAKVEAATPEGKLAAEDTFGILIMDTAGNSQAETEEKEGAE